MDLHLNLYGTEESVLFFVLPQVICFTHKKKKKRQKNKPNSLEKSNENYMCAELY